MTAATAVPAVDISACDREPIHMPGAIQPHGALLVCGEKGLEVVAGAGDLEGLLTPDWRGRSLPDLLGLPAATFAQGAGPVIVDRVRGAAGPLHAIARHSDGRWLVELEPATEDDADAASLLAWLDASGGVFERASDLRELCHRAVAIFRQLTRFDRVMIYRFLDDAAGVVIAEDRDPALVGFLNHHFPASDIPAQARALYIRNRVRVIPDAGYTLQPLRPPQPGLAELDLSDIDLRSVSPIHIQYLKNMGVAASASISIVKDGVLWGLIACHSQTPRTLSHGVRLACQVLAGSLARQVRAKEEAEDYRERLRLRAAEDSVVGRLAGAADLDVLVSQVGEELQRMMGADGFAAIQGRALHMVGRCPDRSDVREVADWVLRQDSPAVLQTHALSQGLPAAEAYADLASGLLAVTVSTEEPTLLLWFRAEKREVVKWAGDPNKSLSLTPDGMLTPRASFDAWSQEVTGMARPWLLPEIDAAQRLTRALLESRQNRRIRDLNLQLGATIADKDRLLAQKDYLIKEVNHRIQNSLQLVSSFLAMQSRAEKEEVLSGHLGEAQRRIAAVALVHRRLYSDDNVEVVDLARYLEDLVVELKVSLGAEWAERITLDLAPIMIPADGAVNIGLILTELVINANKYAYGGAPGPVSISLEQHRNRYRLIVADRGSGKSGKREGFGTRMLGAMVQQLAGTLEEVDNRPGLRVIVTAPIARGPIAAEDPQWAVVTAASSSR